MTKERELWEAYLRKAHARTARMEEQDRRFQEQLEAKRIADHQARESRDRLARLEHTAFWKYVLTGSFERPTLRAKVLWASAFVVLVALAVTLLVLGIVLWFYVVFILAALQGVFALFGRTLVKHLT